MSAIRTCCFLADLQFQTTIGEYKMRELLLYIRKSVGCNFAFNNLL